MSKTYTTINGKVWEHPLPPVNWHKIESVVLSRFAGSSDFFERVWTTYRTRVENGSIVPPAKLGEGVKALDGLVNELVRESSSGLFNVKGLK